MVIHSTYILPLVLLMIATEYNAQTVDLSSFEFRNVGPIRGGRVTTVTGVDSIEILETWFQQNSPSFDLSPQITQNTL